MSAKTAAPTTLLVEIRTEELPPKLLWRLADDFPDSLLAKLQKAGFADANSRRIKHLHGAAKKLATPRRIVAVLENIHAASPAKEIVRRGPQIAACRDSANTPSKALLGFMHSVGATCENDLMEITENGKTYIAWKGEQAGRNLADDLAALVENVLLNLPAPRLMRWGDNDFKFIRPLRGSLMMHGEKTITGKIMNIIAEKHTFGHPFLSPDKIFIKTAGDYEAAMKKCQVLADMDGRRENIREQMTGKDLGASESVLMDDEPEAATTRMGVVPAAKNQVPADGPLLREVTAMCEYPLVHVRTIDKEFMELPVFFIAECVKKHQRAFPFMERHTGKLLDRYCLVADNEPKSPAHMLRGYDAVLRARLCDLRFYCHEDRKNPLTHYVEKLKLTVFHQKLGSQHDRIGRVCKIAAAINKSFYELAFAEAEIAAAARKNLAPLATLMGGEYPALREEIAWEYFAGEDKKEALHEREYKLFYFINICYCLEKLVGMFGADKKPTGSKDPHGLKSAAYSVARELISADALFAHLPDIKEIIAVAVESFAGKIGDPRHEVYEFMLERIRFALSPQAPLRQNGWAAPTLKSNPAILEAVLSQKPHDFRNFAKKINALGRFISDAEKESQTLAAANKRINNIFRKSDIAADSLPAPEPSLFAEDAERSLWNTVCQLKEQTAAAIKKHDFESALKTLAAAAPPADAFFERVLVNAADPKIRENRFALLKELRALLNCVADISRLVS